MAPVETRSAIRREGLGLGATPSAAGCGFIGSPGKRLQVSMSQILKPQSDTLQEELQGQNVSQTSTWTPCQCSKHIGRIAPTAHTWLLKPALAQYFIMFPRRVMRSSAGPRDLRRRARRQVLLAASQSDQATTVPGG